VTPNPSVILVEDDPLFRDLLRLSLSHGGFRILDAVSNSEQAVEAAASSEVDALIIDIEIEGNLDGIDVAKQIRLHKPNVGIVILSAHGEMKYIRRIPFHDSAGWGYLLKNSVKDFDAIARTVRGTIGGAVVMDSEIVSRLVNQEGNNEPVLQPRLMRVLELLTEGYSNSAIADALSLSEKSVETYLNQIYGTLDLSKRADVNPRVAAARWLINEIEDSG
jgi:DNA-binding NarL/FixJ family response regulator